MANSSFEFARGPIHTALQLMNSDEGADFVIRPYDPRDRAAVRTICCDTADCGGPMERFFPDREVFADLLTRYYTDVEPQSASVVEQGGRVVGYLTGCVDTRRFERVMRFRIGPAVFLKALARGTFFRPQVRGLMRANLTLWLKTGAAPSADLSLYPSHLHVNLALAFRGRGAGRQMIERFCAQATRSGSPGVHANVREDNEKARAVFERMGFSRIGRKVLMLMEKDTPPVISIVYGRRLSDEPQPA